MHHADTLFAEALNSTSDLSLTFSPHDYSNRVTAIQGPKRSATTWVQFQSSLLCFKTQPVLEGIVPSTAVYSDNDLWQPQTKFKFKLLASTEENNILFMLSFPFEIVIVVLHPAWRGKKH